MGRFVRYFLGVFLLIAVLWAAQLPVSSLAVTGEADGFSYKIVSGTYCSITGYSGEETQLTVPRQLGGYPVEEIDSYAFQNNASLERISLPEGLISIQSYAFEDCTALTAVSFPASLTSLAARAFYNCTSLAQVDYPAGWSEAPPAGSTRTSPFQGCTALTSVTVPQGVAMIPDYAFRDCTALETISLPDSLTSIGTYAFTGSGLTRLDLPAGLSDVEKYAFQNCDSLAALSLPEGLTTLGSYAFSDCKRLAAVSVPGSLGTLSSYVFSGCDRLETLDLGQGLTAIQSRAFEDCAALTAVSFPASLTSLAARTFYNCTSLAQVDYPAGWSETPPAGFSYTSPFQGCTALTSITVPQGVDLIPDYAFRDCAALETISLPDSLTSIGTYAFTGSGLTRLDLPAGLTDIDEYAFQNCAALTALSLPEGLTTLGSYAFSDCKRLAAVSVPGSLSTLNSYVFSGCDRLETLDLGQGLTAIQSRAFEDCAALTAVSFPASLTSLAARAFSNCTSLAQVDYPAGWSETPPAGSTRTSPFQGCTALTSVTVPQGVAMIPDYAFRDCAALESVSLPDSLTSIGAYAFTGSGLNRLDLPAGSKSIGEYAFQDCDGLVTLVFNDGLETISDYAFSSCANLTTVNIPRSVTACSTSSFRSCPKLTLYCYSGTTAHYTAEAAGWTFILLDQHEHVLAETVEQAPTCTKEGSARYTCSICGYYYVQTLAPLGHSYGAWIVDKEPTYWEEGRRHRVCAVDNAIDSETIPKLEVGEGMGIACFTVVNAQTLEPLSGARITALLDDGTEAAADTGTDGKAQLPLPPGQQTICITAAGCQPRSFRITVTEEITEVPVVGMSSQPVYDATVTSHLMTYEEILEAGIDVGAAENQQVYKYELKLVFEPEIDWLSLTFYMGDTGFLFGGSGGGSGGGAGGGDGGGDSGGSSGSGGSGSRTYVTWVSDGEGRGHFFLPSGASGDGESLSIYPVSEYFYLIVRGEVRWLKEMFDVEMLVVNNSLTAQLEDLTATLELPEGLSLAAMTGEPQTLSQALPDLAGGESHSVHWYVRGDTAGSYSLNARLRGMVMPFEEEINQVFTSENQLQVWAGSALHLHFEFPSSTYYNDDYPITVTLENVSDIPLYNLSHKVQVEQGMVYYYSDGSTEERIETSQWYSSGVLPIFRPGDKLIMEMTVNIFFESKLMEQKLEKLIGIVDGAEQLLNAYKAVEAGVTAAQALQKTLTSAVTVLKGFDFNLQNEDAKKLELFSQLYEKLSALYSAYSSTGDKTLDSLLKMSSAGVTASLDAIAQDPTKWLKETAYGDLSKLVDQVKSLANQLDSGGGESRKFDLFDSIRTLISAIPIRFVLSDVFMTGDADNTTNIPWSYSTTSGQVQYFGVSDLSRTLMSYIQYGFGSMYEDTAPGIFQLVPGLDDPFHKEEAEEYLQTVQDEVTQLKAVAASGSTTFRVWLEQADAPALLSGEENGTVLLSCDNDTARLENGVLTFTGDGLISVTPTSQTGGILHIEDSDGHAYTYNLSVAAPHACTPGAREIVIQPTEAYDGFAVRCCLVCGDILEVELLTTDDLCENHVFGPWETETEATHTTAALQRRQCTVCGAAEYRTAETKPYTQEELPVIIGSGDAVLTNRSGEPAEVCMILAVYSSDGQLLDCRTAVEELEPDGTLRLALPYPPGAGEYAAVYLLDPLTSAPLRPVCLNSDTLSNSGQPAA